MADSDKDLSDADAILSKVDALLARHRAGPGVRGPEPPADFPVLTDIVRLPTATPPEAEPAPVDRAGLERELALEMLRRLAPELERLVEERVRSRIPPRIEAVMRIAGRELEHEMRRLVKEAIDEVLAAELERLRPDR